MLTRHQKEMKESLIMLAGQLALFGLSIFFLGYFYFHDIAPDKRVAEDFTITQCTIIDKNITQSSGAYHRYRTEFRLGFNTRDGVTTEGVASANGVDFSYSTDMAAQQAYYDEFEKGSVYPCWYNPQKPAQVVLVLRHSWYSTLPLLLPVLIALTMIYYIIRSIVDLVEIQMAIKKKTR